MSRTVALDIEQLSKLAGFGDGATPVDPLGLAVNGFSSLARSVALIQRAAEDQDVIDALNDVRERCDALAKLFFDLRKTESVDDGSAEHEQEDIHRGSPWTDDRLKAATDAHMAFLRAISPIHGLPALYDEWLCEARKLISACEVDATTTTGKAADHG